MTPMALFSGDKLVPCELDHGATLSCKCLDRPLVLLSFVALWLGESLRPGRLLLEQQSCQRERERRQLALLLLRRRLQDPPAA
jgi:hypothetical protein